MILVVLLMTNRKETLIIHRVPILPWAKVASDLLGYNSKEYLVTADYYSNVWEVDSPQHEIK